MSSQLFNPQKIQYSQIMIRIKFGQLSSQAFLPSFSCRSEIWILNINNITQFILRTPRKKRIIDISHFITEKSNFTQKAKTKEPSDHTTCDISIQIQQMFVKHLLLARPCWKLSHKLSHLILTIKQYENYKSSS